MTQIASLIESQALADLARAADFASVHAKLSERSIMLPAVVVSSRKTVVGLTAAGHDWFAISARLDTTVAGRDLKALLISSGVRWADPLTQQTLLAIADNVITRDVIATLASSTKRLCTMHSTVTKTKIHGRHQPRTLKPPSRRWPNRNRNQVRAGALTTPPS